jgi:hypothetical protein
MANYQPKPTNGKFKDHDGKVFGRLTVLGFVGNDGNTNHRLWECLCICGKRTTVRAQNLQYGHTTSCGCLKGEVIGARSQTHGATKGRTIIPEYESYSKMKSRCFDTQCRSYPRYGGRGITVCDRWLGKDGFANFLSDLGPMPAGYSIERKDVNGNYCPENCCWIPHASQVHNRGITVYLTADNRTMRIDQWSVETGIAYGTILSRIKRGWSEHDAVMRPVRVW